MMQEKFGVDYFKLERLPEKVAVLKDLNISRELFKEIKTIYSKSRKFCEFHEDKINTLNLLILFSGEENYLIAEYAKRVFVEHESFRVSIENISMLKTDYAPLISEYDLVIAVSYSGMDDVAEDVYELSQSYKSEFILVTGECEYKLNETYGKRKNLKVLSYFKSEFDESDSVFAVLAPIIIFSDLYPNKNEEDVINFNEISTDYFPSVSQFMNLPWVDVKKFAKSLFSNPIVAVFYDWYTFPCALYIKHIFSVFGIRVVLCQKADFHSNTLLLDFGLIIYLSNYKISFYKGGLYDVYASSFDKELSDYLFKLASSTETSYVEIGSNSYISEQWNIDNMFKIPYFVYAICRELGSE